MGIFDHFYQKCVEVEAFGPKMIPSKGYFGQKSLNFGWFLIKIPYKRLRPGNPKIGSKCLLYALFDINPKNDQFQNQSFLRALGQKYVK